MTCRTHTKKTTSIFIADQIEAIRTWRKTSVISSLEIWRDSSCFFFFLILHQRCLLFTSTFPVASQKRQDVNLEQELYIDMRKRYWDVRSRRRIIISNLRQITEAKWNRGVRPSTASTWSWMDTTQGTWSQSQTLHHVQLNVWLQFQELFNTPEEPSESASVSSSAILSVSNHKCRF